METNNMTPNQAPNTTPTPTPSSAPTGGGSTPAAAPAQVSAPASTPKPSPAPAALKTQSAAPKMPAPAKGGSKRSLIVSAIVILVVLIALFAMPKSKGGNDSENGDNTSGAMTAETSMNEGQTSSTSSESGSSSSTLSRAEALAAYTGKMITVGEDCAVTPKDQTQPKGTTILVDNNGKTSHTIMVGPKSYTVSGQHYTLSWLNVTPGTLMVSCDGKDTGARITVK